MLGNHEERYSEKSSTKYTFELIAFDSGNVGYDVSESPIFNFFYFCCFVCTKRRIEKRKVFRGYQSYVFFLWINLRYNWLYFGN